MIYMTDFIVSYCERTDWGLWQEPINLISNFAFIVAFFALVYQIRQFKKVSRIYYFFVSWVLVIGLGSISFHLLATPLAMWLDVVPIFSFIIVYLIWANKRILNRPLWLNLLIVAAFVSLTLLMDMKFKHIAAGTFSYLPAWLFLFIFTMKVWFTFPSVFLRHHFLKALNIFSLALFFRCVDIPLCHFIPFGTHFMWHILNAILLYYLCMIVDLVETYSTPNQLIAEDTGQPSA